MSDPRDLEVRRLEAEKAMADFDTAHAAFGSAISDTLRELDEAEAKTLRAMKRDEYLLFALAIVFVLAWIAIFVFSPP